MGQVINGEVYWSRSDVARACKCHPPKIQRFEELKLIDKPSAQFGRRMFFDDSVARQIIADFQNLLDLSLSANKKEKHG